MNTIEFAAKAAEKSQLFLVNANASKSFKELNRHYEQSVLKQIELPFFDRNIIENDNFTSSELLEKIESYKKDKSLYSSINKKIDAHNTSMLVVGVDAVKRITGFSTLIRDSEKKRLYNNLIKSFGLSSSLELSTINFILENVMNAVKSVDIENYKTFS